MAKPFSFKFTGTRKMQRRLFSERDRLNRNSHTAVNNEGQSIYDMSQSEVPVDKGPLKASGKLDRSEIAEDLTVQITYGDDNVDYAAAVHERDDSKGRKYLERPMQQAESGMARRIAGKVKL